MSRRIDVRWSMILVGMLFLIPAGCSVGPAILANNAIHYNTAVNHSQHEALLLNLVRIRYSEPVCFLQTNAIAASFSVSGSLGATIDVPWRDSLDAGVVGTSELALGGAYADSPTISYTPLRGQDYISRLLNETDSEQFMLLLRSGVSAETLMGTLVERIGELFNLPGGQRNDAYQQFLALIRFLGELQQRGDLEMVDAKTSGMQDDRNDEDTKTNKDDKIDKATSALFMVQCRCRDTAEADRLDRLLGVRTHRLPLSGDAGSRVVAIFAVTGARDLTGEFAYRLRFPVVSISLRNFVEVLYHLARGVDVPESDLSRNLARRLSGGGDSTFQRLIQIKSGKRAPARAFVSVRHRGHHYYIDDNDLDSKETFVLLSILFELQSGNVQGTHPVLTLPVGGR